MKTGTYKIRWTYRYGLGNTCCSIRNYKYAIIGMGVATCSYKDHFCKDTGRRISLARALENANIPKEERKIIWEEYRNMKPNKRW